MSDQPLTLEARYRIAATLASGARASRRLGTVVNPQWSRDGRHCWYATSTAQGLRYQLVDVIAREQRPLFDALALAAALSQAAATAVDALELPLLALAYQADDATLHFTACGARWQWRDAAGELIHSGDAFDIHEAVAPDGLVAVSLNGPNLQLRHHDARTAQRVTDDGVEDCTYGDYRDDVSAVANRLNAARKPSVLWSPDSQTLAVLRSDLRQMPVRQLQQAAPPDGGPPVTHHYRYATPRDTHGARHTLWFIRRDRRRIATQLPVFETWFSSPFPLGHARWSADGLYLDLLIGNRYSTEIALWRIHAPDGAAECLHTETGSAIVTASPSIGEPPVFQVLRDGRLLWWSQRDGWGHLYLLQAGAAPKQLTAGEWQVRSLLRVDEERQEILFTASGREPGADPYLCLVYRAGFDGGKLTLLTPELAQHEAFSISPNGSHWLDTYSAVDTPPRTVMRDREGTALMLLAEANTSAERPADILPPEPFTVTALDGRTALWGTLFKPLGFDATRQYPVIEVIYGAPQTAVVPKNWTGNHHSQLAEQLAALGFVALIIDGPGTTNRSRDFLLAVHGHLEGCGGLPDHVNVIQQLAATRPWMDTRRVGIVGGSGGGYATVRALATFPDFYTIGAALCGNHDAADYTAFWGYTYQGPYSPELYAGQDNKQVASHIIGKLLLMHGEMDDNVHPEHTLKLAEALRAQGRDFTLDIVPNANHMLVLLPEVRQRVYDYFVQHLLGVVPPAERTGASA